MYYAFDEYNINSNLERIEVDANGRMGGTRSLNTKRKLHKRYLQSTVSTSRSVFTCHAQDINVVPCSYLRTVVPIGRLTIAIDGDFLRTYVRIVGTASLESKESCIVSVGSHRVKSYSNLVRRDW